MRKIIASAFVCLLPVLALGQSGRKNLADYKPQDEVKAIFNQELNYLQKMVGYVYTTRTTYTTPADGRVYERISEVGRRDSGLAFERKKVSCRSNQKRLKNYYYLFTGQVLNPNDMPFYAVSRLREEEGLVVWGVNPTVVPERGRLFRGEIWINDRHEIVRAAGEYVPRWQNGVYAFTCTLYRDKGLPSKLTCSDSLVDNGTLLKVEIRVDFYGFKRFGVSSVAELGDIAEEDQ